MKEPPKTLLEARTWNNNLFGFRQDKQVEVRLVHVGMLSNPEELSIQFQGLAKIVISLKDCHVGHDLSIKTGVNGTKGGTPILVAGGVLEEIQQIHHGLLQESDRLHEEGRRRHETYLREEAERMETLLNYQPPSIEQQKVWKLLIGKVSTLRKREFDSPKPEWKVYQPQETWETTVNAFAEVKAKLIASGWTPTRQFRTTLIFGKQGVHLEYILTIKYDWTQE